MIPQHRIPTTLAPRTTPQRATCGRSFCSSASPREELRAPSFPAAAGGAHSRSGAQVLHFLFPPSGAWALSSASPGSAGVRKPGGCSRRTAPGRTSTPASHT